MCSNTIRFDSLPKKTQALKEDFMKCSPNRNSTLIVCVSKLFPFEKKFLPQNRQRALTQEEIINRRKLKELEEKSDNKLETNAQKEDNIEITETNDENNKQMDDNDKVFIAFARVFSGSIRSGDTVYVLGPKHNPNKIDDNIEIDSNLTVSELSSDQHITKCQIKDLYILMGRELESANEVCAGNILGIGGLENHILKSGTLSSTIYCPPFIDLHLTTSIPILRVALEPQNPSEMPKLVNALKMLNQSDPCVDVKIQETGEHVIVTTGEVHLQRCITDLTQFSSIDINCSEPIVPFRETIVEPPKLDMTNELISAQRPASGTSNTTDGRIELYTVNKKSKIRFIAKPLPQEVCKLLEQNTSLLKIITRTQRKSAEFCEQITEKTLNSIQELRSRLKTAFIEAKWPEETVDQIWSIGPKYCGTNLLLSRIPDFNDNNVLQQILSKDNEIRNQYENSFVSGFQLATLAGPLCDEPLMSVCFIAEEWAVSSDNLDLNSGQIMSTVKECCRRSFQAQPQRLMAAMFSCSIQVDNDALVLTVNSDSGHSGIGRVIVSIGAFELSRIGTPTHHNIVSFTTAFAL
ncbi:unnamed protein product, partial [Medioppia subpectinata]